MYTINFGFFSNYFKLLHTLFAFLRVSRSYSVYCIQILHVPVIDHPAYWVDRHGIQYSNYFSWQQLKNYKPEGREMGVEIFFFFFFEGSSLFVRSRSSTVGLLSFFSLRVVTN